MTPEHKEKLAAGRRAANEKRKAALETHPEDCAGCAICEPAPNPTTPPPPAAPKAQGPRKKTVITEKTAGRLCEGVFLILAFLQNEEEWLLDDDDREMLEGPAADSLAMVPGPIAKAVNDYSAPGLLATAVLTIVKKKQKRIAAKRAGDPIPKNVSVPIRHGKQQPAYSVEQSAADAIRENSRRAAAQNGAATVAQTPDIPAEVLAAANAARSSLIEHDVDERSEMDIVS